MVIVGDSHLSNDDDDAGEGKEESASCISNADGVLFSSQRDDVLSTLTFSHAASRICKYRSILCIDQMWMEYDAYK